MTFSINNPEGVATTPLGKYAWEKPSGEQGLNIKKKIYVLFVLNFTPKLFFLFNYSF